MSTRQQPDVINSRADSADPKIESESSAGIMGGDGRFRLAFERAPLGMAIIDLDFKMHRANEALCKALGYSEEELIALNQSAITHPDDIERDTELAHKLIEGKIPSYQVEKRFVTKDGGLALLDLTAVLIRTPQKEPLYILAMVEDFTEIKRTQEALRTSEERYRSFVVNSTEGIWRFEVEQPIDITLPVEEQIALFYKHGYLAECNDAMARMYGHDRAGDLVGSRFGDLPLAANPADLTSMRKFFNNGYRLQSVESIKFESDGSKKYFSNSVIGIVINGRLLRIWGTQTDETQRRRAENELKTSHAQLRSLAGRLQSIREQERTDIAREMHDVLGQSLTSLKLDLAWIKKRLLNPASGLDQSSLEQKLDGTIAELDKTIDVVKTLSTELRPGILDKCGLSAAIEWQCKEFEERTGIKCSCVVPEQELSLNNDRSTALFRILQEALVNVVRHAKAKSTEVELQVDKSNLTLKIHDDGKGISESEITDPSSLGLLGMRERAEFLGGNFRIEEDSGTTAIAKIPLTEQANSGTSERRQ